MNRSELKYNLTLEEADDLIRSGVLDRSSSIDRYTGIAYDVTGRLCVGAVSHHSKCYPGGGNYDDLLADLKNNC